MINKSIKTRAIGRFRQPHGYVRRQLNATAGGGEILLHMGLQPNSRISNMEVLKCLKIAHIKT